MDIYKKLKIYDKDRKIEINLDRCQYLINYITGKSVLHVGCSDYPITKERLISNNLLHKKLAAHACNVVGIDISEQGIEILKDNGFLNVHIMDAEKINFPDKFDIVLAGDVIEHINNPGLFVDKSRDLINTGGEIIVCVPSALTFNNYKAWFLGYEQVHCDHNYYFSPKTLANLFSRFDFIPVKLVFTVQPPERFEGRIFLFFRKSILKICRNMSPSFIMHFKKREDTDCSNYIEWK